MKRWGGGPGPARPAKTPAPKGERIMTVVGKILVFLNLVFSLVVGGFAVVDYAARTHWAKAFDDVKAQNGQLLALAQSYKADSERAAKEKADLYDQLAVQRV